MMMCRGVDVEVRRRVAGGARGGGFCRSSPCSWTPRIDAWSACEGATSVREARESPAVRNRAADRTHLRRRSMKSRHGCEPRSRQRTQERSWALSGATAVARVSYSGEEQRGRGGAGALRGTVMA